MSTSTEQPQPKVTAQTLAQAMFFHREPAHRALVTVDPWSASFVEDAQSALGQTVHELWPQVLGVLAGLPQTAALQQAWAVALRAPMFCALLYRASVTAGTPAVRQEAERLRTLTLKRWQADRVVQSYVASSEHAVTRLLIGDHAPDELAPDLGSHTPLPGSIRLRYRLAWHCRQGATLTTLLKLAARQKAASEYQRRVELERAFHHAVAAGRQFRPLREVEIALLEDREQTLLLSLRHLWPLTLTQALYRKPRLREHVATLVDERQRVQDTLSNLMNAVRGRRLGQLQALTAEAGQGPIALALWRTLRQEPWGLEDDYAHCSRKPEFGLWLPTTEDTLATLQRFAPRPLPAWWAMKASEVAGWLVAPDEAEPAEGSTSGGKPQRPQRMTVQDLAPLQRTWSRAEQVMLLRAGLPQFISDASTAWEDLTLAELADLTAGLYQRGRMLLARRLKALPDARPWLALMASKRGSQASALPESGAASAPSSPAGEAAKALRDLARQTIDEHFRDQWGHAWGRWVVTSAGTPVWRSMRDLALERTRLLEDALVLLEERRTPLDPQGLRLAIAQALHDPRQVPREPVSLLLRWLQLDPAATPVLAAHGPVHLLLDLASHRQTPEAVLQALVDLGPPATPEGSVRMTAWRHQLRQAGTAQRLQELVLQPPERGPWVWSPHWTALHGDHLPLALVLAARRSGWRLIELQKHLDAVPGQASHATAGTPAPGTAVAATSATGTFATALSQAAALLAPTSPREAATLELINALGVQVAPHLLRVLAMARRGAPAGHKLNHAYKQHLLPKKSGGSRVISAPDAGLKRVQRAVLERLLAPLGLHDAAHGFAPGRNIVGNARVHVGQSVVVNADVRSCFPSVRWPLVLAALRRDLSARLSPVALSFLCDLCTSEGGLPVGAPTSPALLNRVLLKTDEILSAAAIARGVRYTRYADDLSFSGGDAAVQMLGIARRTLGQIGLELDPRKTNIFRRGRRQVVTGLVVNDQVSVPRRIRRRLRAAVHRVEQGQVPLWQDEEQGLDALQGRLSFVRMVHPEEGAALMKRLGALKAGTGASGLACAATEVEASRPPADPFALSLSKGFDGPALGKVEGLSPNGQEGSHRPDPT
jgi:retron-type reverse transcriptase